MTINMVCGVSGITIENEERVKVFLLLHSDHLAPYTMRRSTSTRNLYFPICLPITAIYDNEGTIADVERDITVQCLEQFFGCSFEILWSNITEDWLYRTEKKPEQIQGINDFVSKYGSISVMFVHEDVYDQYASLAPNKYEVSDSETEDFSKSTMKALGFTFIGVDESRERFDQQWDLDDHTVFTDGNYIVSSTGHLVTGIKADKYGYNDRLETLLNRNFSFMDQYPYAYFFVKNKMEQSEEDWFSEILYLNRFHVLSHLETFDPLSEGLYTIEQAGFLLTEWVKFLGFEFVFRNTNGNYLQSCYGSTWVEDKWQVGKTGILISLLQKRLIRHQKEAIELGID